MKRVIVISTSLRHGSNSDMLADKFVEGAKASGNEVEKILSNSNIYLASKPRYEILDGLRGVAAMLVVAYHLFETYFHGAPDQPINHGYLAVDFFFVLSGFVIGYQPIPW